MSVKLFDSILLRCVCWVNDHIIDNNRFHAKMSNLHRYWWWSLVALVPFPHWRLINIWQVPLHVSLSPSAGQSPHNPATPSFFVHTWSASAHQSETKPVWKLRLYLVLKKTILMPHIQIPPAWISQSWWTGSVPTGTARPPCEEKEPHHQNTQVCISHFPHRPKQDKILFVTSLYIEITH